MPHDLAHDDTRRRRLTAPARRVVALGAALAAAAVVLLVATACGSSTSAPATTAPSGISTATGGAPATVAPATPPPVSTAAAPWPAPTDVLPYIQAAGLPALGSEQLAFHIHAHLDVIVDGNPQVVPAGIGIDVQRQLISPLHTHDTTGIIHIESPQQVALTLGQFFTEWGVRLDARCIGAYCASADQPVATYVDGKRFSGDPQSITLTAHEEIAIVVGAQQDIPSSYAFPPGD